MEKVAQVEKENGIAKKKPVSKSVVVMIACNVYHVALTTAVILVTLILVFSDITARPPPPKLDANGKKIPQSIMPALEAYVLMAAICASCLGLNFLLWKMLHDVSGENRDRAEPDEENDPVEYKIIQKKKGGERVFREG